MKPAVIDSRFYGRAALFVFVMCLFIALAIQAKPTNDGGPLPMCPPCKEGTSGPKCGPNCSLKQHENTSSIITFKDNVIIADGTDPMPICRNGRDATGRPCGGGR